MLQAINDRSKGWLGILIVALITLPFAFWGIQSYIGTGGEKYAAKVNSVEISKREFEQTLSTQRQRLQQQFGGKLPFSDSILKERVMDQLINRKLLEETANNSGYRISDSQLAENIKKVFSRDGKFDREYVNQVLRSNGMTASQMEYQIRNDLLVSQVMDALTNTSFVTDDEVQRLAELEYEQRTISTLTFSLDHFSSDIEVTEEEIKSAYEKDSNRYMLPEKMSIEYVELKSDALLGDVKVDESAIKNMYKEYVATISQKEKRKAKHILLKTGKDESAARAQLTELRKKLKSGASFDELAKAHSQDIGSAKQGGDLGWVEYGQMVKPFEDALYAMKEGEISDIVESEFGLHLIKLEKIKKEPVESLAEKRTELETTFKKEVISDKFYELSETMAETAYEHPDSLISVSEAVNAKPKTTQYFTRKSGNGIAGNEKVRSTAFSKLVLEDGSNSDVIELSPEHILVLRMLDRKPATVMPFESVHASIMNTIKLKKSHEKTLAVARDAKVKINTGQATIKDIVNKGVTLKKTEMLTRKDTQKADVKVLEAAFSTSASEEGKVHATDVSLSTGDVALVIVDKVHTPDIIDKVQVDLLKKQFKQDVSTMEFNTALKAIRDKADLYISSNNTK